ERGDLDAVAMEAHQRKGTAGAYGFPAITQAAAELGASLRADGTLDGAPPPIHRLLALRRRPHPGRPGPAASAHTASSPAPTGSEEFVGALDRAVRSRRLRGEVKRLRLMGSNLPRVGEILTGSPAIQALCEVLDRVAESDASVLITGESGTGKELVARALHRGG